MSSDTGSKQEVDRKYDKTRVSEGFLQKIVIKLQCLHSIEFANAVGNNTKKVYVERWEKPLPKP